MSSPAIRPADVSQHVQRGALTVPTADGSAGGTDVSDAAPLPVKVMSGGAGAGGDASAVNQQLTIDKLQEILIELQTTVANLPAPAESATVTHASVAGATTANGVVLLAANTDRLGGAIVNDSTAILYVKLGVQTASSTSYDYFLAGSVSGVPAQMELPEGYVGAVYGIWATATGNARVSERTA